MPSPATFAWIAASLGLAATAHAANPLVQTLYTADPAPVVHDGILYLFTSHDEDELVKNFFTMRDWRCYSTTDMANWTDHGAVASLRNFAWAGSGDWGGGFANGAWAPQAIQRDGKWYLYAPLHGRGIGVLVADNPFGPYSDPLGRPLIRGDHIDPSVLVADDGQAYLYWGNPKCWYAKLNRDMISLDESIGDKGLVAFDMTPEAFGPRSQPDEKRATSYEEGPWIYKRAARHYLFYAAGPLPEHIAYATAETPVGPWRYGGVVMPAQGGSFTNHPGVVDYKGRTYLFYHDASLPGGGGFHRSVCAEELQFAPDGSVVPVNMTRRGPSPVATLDPYRRVEAETIAWAHGVRTGPASERPGDMAVQGIDDGDRIAVRNVDFGAPGARAFSASVASDKQTGATIELRLDRVDGPLIGALAVGDTQGRWESATTEVSGATGVHDLFLVFKGPPAGDLFRFDHWTFSR